MAKCSSRPGGRGRIALGCARSDRSIMRTGLTMDGVEERRLQAVRWGCRRNGTGGVQAGVRAVFGERLGRYARASHMGGIAMSTVEARADDHQAVWDAVAEGWDRHHEVLTAHTGPVAWRLPS